MKITRQEDYAITLVSAIAQNPGFLSLRQIGKQYSLPKPFLKKIARRLKAAGILSVKEGRGGGYRLARPANKITAAEVLRAFNPDPFLTSCTLVGHKTVCDKYTRCKSRIAWQKISNSFYRDLKKITLAEIAQ